MGKDRFNQISEHMYPSDFFRIVLLHVVVVVSWSMAKDG